ncbi:hypothetical protein [Pseudomonas sp. GZD-209]|uniref:hypothetical protein n=1 Tax=Pseudomonas sp. GZD-209 TaxID=3404807 RepID=UPI003BB6F407
MMQMLSFPMYSPSGSKISLEDVLGFIPDNSWNWYIFDFYGMGCPPSGNSMDSFEENIRSSNNGISMTWPELRFFARSLEQTIDLQLIAAKAGAILCREEIEDKNLSNIEIFIEAVDSSEWSIWARDITICHRIRGVV